MANYQGSKINPKRFSVSQIKFYIILLPMAIFFAIPVVFMFSQAFKTLGELNAFPPTIIVRNPTFDNFRALFSMTTSTGVPMSRYLFNSLFVTLSTVLINLVITIMAAYALSKKKYKLMPRLIDINQIALMFVATAVAIPRYLIIVKTGMMNTWWAHILPTLALPVALFLVKQTVDQIPDALIEAAVVDGAGDAAILRKIIVPLTRPALATSVVLTFQTIWGDATPSNNYMTSETMRTLVYYFNSISTNAGVAAAGRAAVASLLLFIPNLIIFIIMQSKVMSTMSNSGIK